MDEDTRVEYIARFRESDGSPRSLMEHLISTSELASIFSAKIGMPSFGAVMGLVHDMGKYAKAFQDYIKSSAGHIEPDDDDYVESRKMRGKIDHSSAGAQYIWHGSGKSNFQQLAANMLALCIASHHTGLIDCLSPDGTDVISKRMNKADDKTHYSDALACLEDEIRIQAKELLESPSLEEELKTIAEQMKHTAVSAATGQFALGFLTRFLFSVLIDADRLNSAERTVSARPDWSLLCGILEANLAGLRRSRWQFMRWWRNG